MKKMNYITLILSIATSVPTLSAEHTTGQQNNIKQQEKSIQEELEERYAFFVLLGSDLPEETIQSLAKQLDQSPSPDCTLSDKELEQSVFELCLLIVMLELQEKAATIQYNFERIVQFTIHKSIKETINYAKEHALSFTDIIEKIFEDMSHAQA